MLCALLLGEAGEARPVPLLIVLHEGGGEGQVAVEQVGSALLHHAKPVLGFGLGHIGADLDVEGAVCGWVRFAAGSGGSRRR